MSGKRALTTIALACALSLALVGCGGGSASSGATSSATSSAMSSSAAGSSASSAVASSGAASAGDNHDSYFVGKWDLYETEEATHEQVVDVMEKYATDKEVREKMNEAYGRDNVEFCIRFAADGTGSWDTGEELVSFTWEASNAGAVTFTSFDGKETALHIPVTDDKITVNGDTFAKAS